MLWPNLITKGFHKSGVGSSITLKKTKYSSGDISGRLVGCKSGETKMNTRPRDNAESHCSTRMFDKCRQINFNTKSVHNLHRGLIQSRSRDNPANPGESTMDYFCCTQSNEWQNNGQTLLTFTGENSIMPGTDSECEIIYEADTITYSRKLESIKNESRISDSMYSKAKSSFEMVVVFSKHYARPIFNTFTTNNYSHNRCFTHGMERSHKKSNGSGSLDRTNEVTTHKQFRVSCCVSDNQNVSKVTSKQTSFGQDRQHNCGSIYKQTGWNTLSLAMSASLGSMDVCIRTQHGSESSSHCGSQKYISRSVESDKDPINRIEVDQCGSPKNISNLGSSNKRSICHIREQEGGGVLFLDSTSTISNSRCINHKLGQYVCISISSSDSYPKGTAAHAEISMRDNTDSPILAHTTLVSSITTIACSISTSNSNSRKSVDSGKKKSSTSRSGHIQVDCMASINKRLNTRGFSENAQKLLSASWRLRTQKDYKCKFRKFHCWCSEQEIDPYTAL